MPFVRINDARLHYRTDGDPARPCLVFSNSLGTDLGMWDAQAAALARDFFVLRYDTRGHGESERGRAPLGLADLGRDVVGLLDALGIDEAHFCGISMGGLTGQWLGIHQPGRIGKLVLANTAACIGTAEGWNARAELVRREGMAGVADGAAARWFTPAFIERAPRLVDSMTASLRAQDPEGYSRCCEALARADLRAAVSAIPVPTLVVAGAQDPVTTVADGEWLCRQIPGARLETVPASHISNVEAESAFTRVLSAFLGA